MNKKVLLMILDGVGLNTYGKERNALKRANTPNLRYLADTYPKAILEASGPQVGLPLGQMGNSETGHLNIGAGRIVYQILERINNEIKTGAFYENKVLLEAINHAKENNTNLHIMGLLSDGGIHSHIDQIIALIDMAKANGVSNILIHVFTDGRDTYPNDGIKFIEKLESHLKELGVGKIATVMGRFYGMDRDKRVDRVNLAYNAIANGIGHESNNVIDYMNESYKNNITDEFIEPAVFETTGIHENDSIIHANFRPDRIIELFERIENENNVKTTTMTFVKDTISAAIAFPKESIKNTLGEYLAKNGKTQMRIAETEKYAHVTYFFDGGEEKDLDGCRRIIINSPKVKTYDLKPEMSADEITTKLIEEWDNNPSDVTILNFANGDMVGHTGNLDAATLALEKLDECIKIIYNKAVEHNITIMITADHGNCDYMVDDNGNKVTAHSVYPVPFIICDKNVTVKNGKLGDIAPSILSYLEMDVPSEMTGEVLITKKERN